MLSSVYFKPPENFVKKIRDRINERLDLENEDLLGAFVEKMDEISHDVDYEDSMGIKKSEYIKESGNIINDYNELII
jgi:sugar-specific transcriptional regulator TrmB